MSQLNKLEPPQTPSETLNSKLAAMAEPPPETAVKTALVHLIFGYVKTMVLTYNQLTNVKALQDKWSVKQLWIASVVLVALLVVCLCTVVYNVIISLSFLFIWALYYIAVVLSLTACGVSGWAVVAFQGGVASPKKSGSSQFPPRPEHPDSHID